MTCLPVTSLFHYFTSSILKTQHVPSASNGSSGVPNSPLLVHDVLSHKPQDLQEKDTAKEGGEGSSQRQGELKSPHAESHTVAEKRSTWKLCKSLNGGPWEDKLRQCLNKSLHAGKNFVLVLRYKISVPCGQQHGWGKLLGRANYTFHLWICHFLFPLLQFPLSALDYLLLIAMDFQLIVPSLSALQHTVFPNSKQSFKC